MFIHKPPPFVQTHMSFEVVEFWIKELRIAASIGRHWQRQRSSSLIWERLCKCQNQIWRQEGGKTLKDNSQGVLMSSLFPAPISAATTCWEVFRTSVEIFKTLGKSEEEFAAENLFNIAMALIWSGESADWDAETWLSNWQKLMWRFLNKVFL